MQRLPLNTTPAKAALKVAAAMGALAAGLGILYPSSGQADNVAARHASTSVLSPVSLTRSGRVPGAAVQLAQAPAQPSPTPTAVDLQALATGSMAAFKATSPPAVFSGVAIVDAAGKPRPIEGWKGRVVLLNLWAMWCAPCLKEMPDLDKLKVDLGGADFDVVALNIDKAPEKAQKFLSDNNIKALEFLRDPTAKAFVSVNSQGMPTTLLLDRQGREIGRLVGPAEWNSAEAKALISTAVAAK
jgi:thiol-disulfide isomerase/thioredoxin